MDKLDIKEFMPSKTFKDYITENNIKLNDKQKAKLIFKYPTYMRNKLDAYTKLMKETSNLVLAKHLENLIMYEERLIESVYKRIDDAVYVLTTYELSDDGCDYEDNKGGIYKSITSAENIGKKSKEHFDIHRYIVAPLTLEKQSEIEDEMEREGYLMDTDDMYISYNSSGEIDYIYSRNSIDNELEDKYCEAESYIEDYFMNLPIPFKNGDIVKSLKYDDKYGIIFIPNDIEEYHKQLIRKGCTPDDEMLAEFINDNGDFGHDHLLVTQMELANKDEIPEKYHDILVCASDTVNGSGHGSLQCLQYFIYYNLKK